MRCYMSTFLAEIKQVNSCKSPSLDIIYKLVLESDDPTVIDLGKLPADTLVRVTLEKA